MSPANPTGAIIDKEEFARICAFCDAAGIVFVSDEIYHGLEYGRAGGNRAEFHAKGDRREFLLKILRHDRLAAGLARRAGRADPPAGAPPAVARHLRADDSQQRRSPPSTRPRSWRKTARPMRAIARCCLSACPQWGSTNSRRPTAPSTSMRTSRPSPPTRWIFAGGCSRGRRGGDARPRFRSKRGASAVRFSYAGAETDVAEGVARFGAWLGPLSP